MFVYTLLKKIPIEHNNNNNNNDNMLLICCTTNPVRRRTKSISISLSGVPFIGKGTIRN